MLYRYKSRIKYPRESLGSKFRSLAIRGGQVGGKCGCRDGSDEIQAQRDKLAAVQKYCCFRRNSLPTENADGNVIGDGVVRDQVSK